MSVSKKQKKKGKSSFGGASSSPGDFGDELCPICDDICTCRKKKPIHQSGSTANNSLLWQANDFSLAPARTFPLEYSSDNAADTDESEFDEAWMKALYTSSSCQEDDDNAEEEDDEEREIMEEEEAFMLGEEDDMCLPPEAEKILYDYYAEQRQKDSSSLVNSSSTKPTPVIVPEMLELEFDLDQSRWGSIDITPASNSVFVVTPTHATNSSQCKEVPDLTPQVLAAISAATKQSHRIITIAEIDQSDMSEDIDDALSLWSQLITDLDTQEEDEEDDEDEDDDSGSGSGEEEESEEDYTSDSKEAEQDEWYRYKRIPINAFYKSRKGHRSSATKQIVVPQGALRARGETVYLSAPINYNTNNVLLRYTADESERAENEDEGLYWKSTMMDIY